ncbi:hypothetical protein RB195_000095 [Necator americanus]|uniref:Uncharacterized protein n=1 Tax=Necator americanus TaxID=51031 RepID=A0ABR1D939_NECAM
MSVKDVAKKSRANVSPPLSFLPSAPHVCGRAIILPILIILTLLYCVKHNPYSTHVLVDFTSFCYWDWDSVVQRSCRRKSTILSILTAPQTTISSSRKRQDHQTRNVKSEQKTDILLLSIMEAH